MWIVLALSLSTLSWHKVVAFSLLTVSVVLAVLNNIDNCNRCSYGLQNYKW